MSKKTPTHEVFVVRDNEKKDDKSFWTKVGAAWEHADNEGFYIKLDFPVGALSLTIRKKNPKPEK